jgi:hypothetical protein
MISDDTGMIFEFDIALSLSFAGENRAYVADIAERLRSRDIRVFYDQYEQTTLWGKNLIENTFCRSASMTQKSLACTQPSVTSMLDTRHRINSFN